jgi:uncharacterized damage-inducible protein DinB
MNKEDFSTLYDFNAWANLRTLDSCAALSPDQFTRDLASSFRSVRDTLAHIYGAEWIWLERWHGRTPSALPAPADFPDLDSVRRRLTAIDRDLVDYVASLSQDDVQRVLEFKAITAGTVAQPLWQCLQHLANHSTYHRGQIATMLRQLGGKATSTDMVVFYRDRAQRSAT